MKRRSRWKHKGRSESGQFLALPHALLDSPNFCKLSGAATKLLVAIARQFNGSNNGDMCATFSMMRQRGIGSQETLNYALAELRHFGMIELTRQGGRHMASLYAVTWLSIDDCKGKLHVSSTRIASGTWKEPRPPFIRAKKKIS